MDSLAYKLPGGSPFGSDEDDYMTMTANASEINKPDGTRYRAHLRHHTLAR